MEADASNNDPLTLSWFLNVHKALLSILFYFLINVSIPHGYRWREAEPICLCFWYVRNQKETKKSAENVVHIQLCFFYALLSLDFLSKNHEHNTWGGKLSVVKEIKTEFKQIFLFHILIIFSSHNSILVFCLLCPDDKCASKIIQPELITFL